jgi:hypothetical protein
MKGPSISIVILALAGALAASLPAFAAQPAEQVTAAVETSGVSRQDREALLQEADRALKAGVPAADLESIVRRGWERGMTPAQVRELIRTAAQAGEQGLYVRPVLARIQQGLAKGVPAERILAATRQLTVHLAAAGPLVQDLEARGLRAGSSDDRAYAAETVARALERSVAPSMITDLGEVAVQHGTSMAQFDRAVRSLTLFVGAGVPADRAGTMVRETIEHRFTDREQARLERRVAELVGQGRPMDEIIGTMEHDISTLRDPGDRRSNGGRDRGPGADRDAGGRGGRGR